MTEEPTKPLPIAVADTRYLLVVGGLMVTIILLLAFLWLRERGNAAEAWRQVDLARRAAVAQGDVRAALGRMLGGERAAPPLRREDLPAETVQWNGRSRTVLRISAAAGQRMGLQPGDVVEVAPPPPGAAATQPSTQPQPPGE